MKQTILLLAGICLVAACASPSFKASVAQTPSKPFPSADIAVISDVHYFATELGTSGKAWETYLHNDRKMLGQSAELAGVAVDTIIAAHPQVLLITGDLTKDGEKLSHQGLAKLLGKVKDAGISVFVVPGNHDVLNPDAKRFVGDGTESVENVTPTEFASIYNDFGFGKAILRDTGSLSYLAEPIPGLLLLAIDSARYGEEKNPKAPITAGRIDQGRADFIKKALEYARTENKPIFAMMHHGVNEHYTRQKDFFGEYVVEDNDAVAKLLVDGGVRFVFTGHFHANDITGRDMGTSRPLYDIETGSLVTYPSPMRFVRLEGLKAEIKTSNITHLPSFDAAGKDFVPWAKEFTYEGIGGIAVETMTGLGMSRQEAELLAPQIGNAFLAHYAGDETPPANPKLHGDNLSFMGGLVVGSKGPVVESLWKDLPPADDNLVIELPKE